MPFRRVTGAVSGTTHRLPSSSGMISIMSPGSSSNVSRIGLGSVTYPLLVTVTRMSSAPSFPDETTNAERIKKSCEFLPTRKRGVPRFAIVSAWDFDPLSPGGMRGKVNAPSWWIFRREQECLRWIRAFAGMTEGRDSARGEMWEGIRLHFFLGTRASGPHPMWAGRSRSQGTPPKLSHCRPSGSAGGRSAFQVFDALGVGVFEEAREGTVGE